MSVLDQRQTNPSRSPPDWRRPAGICASLVVLGALLGGAIWMQTAGPISQPKTHGYPLMPTVPLKIGFYDLENLKVKSSDPVLSKFAALHLDFLLLHHTLTGGAKDAARIAGMIGPDIQIVSKFYGGNFHPFAQDFIIARHPLTNVERLDIDGEPYGIWAESKIGDRVIYLASISRGQSQHSVFADLQRRWQGLSAAPQPLPPIVIGLGDSTQFDVTDLVQPGTGWFDASAAFWDHPAAPPAGHLFFSTGWSITNGQTFGTDPARRGYVITTAGAPPPATQAAGEGEE